MPNQSLEPTRYGMRCKPGPRHMVHHRSPGLHARLRGQLGSNGGWTPRRVVMLIPDRVGER